MSGISKLSEATFQPYAECDDDACSWGCDTSALARDRAKRHARSTGHRVRIVVARVALWGPT